MASIPGPVSPAWSGVAPLRHAAVLAVALACVGILAVHAETAASIVAIWWRSETYAHGFIVLPICAWLAWQRRDALALAPARPWTPALAVVALSGALWLVMSLADVVGVRQFALAFMLQAAIVAVVGLRVARIIAFPLAFLLFAVPAGEFMIPTLIEWTADFTVAALRASGVPVYREANHFIIPSGAWSVVEACSGLRYLIASVMIGVVYASVTYRTASRRAAFIGASVIVPVLANWLRAYMIVMLGHLSNNRLAAGVDHIIYGWLFFGIVMALLFWIGSFWSESAGPAERGAVVDAAHRAPATASGPMYLTAIAAIAIAGIWRPMYVAFESPASAGVSALAPVAAANGFAPVAVPPSEWLPSYSGFSSTLRQGFASSAGAAGLYIAYYRNQAKGRELVTSGNQLVLPQDDKWKEVDRRTEDVTFAGQTVRALRIEVSGVRERLVAYRLFWVDGHVTGSEYVAKARIAWSRLRGRPGDAALIVTFAREEGRDVAREALEAMSRGIKQALDATEVR